MNGANLEGKKAVERMWCERNWDGRSKGRWEEGAEGFTDNAPDARRDRRT